MNLVLGFSGYHKWKISLLIFLKLLNVLRNSTELLWKTASQCMVFFLENQIQSIYYEILAVTLVYFELTL